MPLHRGNCEGVPLRILPVSLTLLCPFALRCTWGNVSYLEVFGRFLLFLAGSLKGCFVGP